MTFFRSFVTLKAVAACINYTRQALSFGAATAFGRPLKSTLANSLPPTGTSAFAEHAPYPYFAEKHFSSNPTTAQWLGFK